MKLILIIFINIFKDVFSSFMSLTIIKKDINFSQHYRNAINIDTTRIYGNSSNLHYYYVNIYVGSKHKKQSLIIDTGSSLTGFPCEGICKKCGAHLNPYYSHKGQLLINLDSNTSKLLSCSDALKINLKCDSCNNDNLCSYHQSYGEGSSYNGLFVKDIIYFGDNLEIQNGFTMPFGCHSTYNELLIIEKQTYFYRRMLMVCQAYPQKSIVFLVLSTIY